PIMGRRFRPRWATTTATTTQNEFPDISVASQVTQSLVEGTRTYVAVAYARKKLHSLPPSVGRLLLFEGAPEQVGHVEDAIATSTRWTMRQPRLRHPRTLKRMHGSES